MCRARTSVLGRLVANLLLYKQQLAPGLSAWPCLTPFTAPSKGQSVCQSVSVCLSATFPGCVVM